MLKIKDNIDLKELEKYGFKLENNNYERKINNNWWELLIVDVEDREIYKMTEEIGYWTTTFTDDDFWDNKYIDDLIKDGLVEKVEE